VNNRDRVLVQIRPDEAKLLQEINWEMVRELKQIAGDTEIKKE
jgi:hypothetical protein